MTGASNLLIVLLLIEVAVFGLFVWRLGLLFVVVFGAIGSCIGLFVLASQAGESAGYAWLFLVGNVTMVAGYGFRLFFSKIAPQKRAVGDAGNQSSDVLRLRESALRVTAVVVGFLAMYHLSIVGFPVFADDIEVQRFDFTSSGFFGIPGRMFLFGVPIVWAAATVAVVLRGSSFFSSKAWGIASFFLLLTSLLGGFKSGIAAMATTVVIVLTIARQSQPRIVAAIRQYWWLAVGALAYGALVASSYVTYQREGGSLLDQLVNRLTVVAAAPKRAALLGSVQLPSAPFLSDFWYFLRKYSGQSIGTDFTVERAVSASLIGADPSSNAWTTPVTVGGVPELVLILGTPLALVVCFGLGWLMRSMYDLRTLSFTRLVFVSVSALALATWLSRGGLAYYALNYAIVGLLVVVVYLLAVVVIRGLRRRRLPESADRMVREPVG